MDEIKKNSSFFTHYTVLASGIVGELEEGFECPKGNAYMGMKVWAESLYESADVYQSIARQIGFAITGDIKIYKTDPKEPPGQNPWSYDITFTPFEN